MTPSLPKYNFFASFSFVFLLTMPHISLTQSPFAKPGGLGGLQVNPQELEDLEETLRYIENQVAQMTPEQQAEFAAQVERTQKNLEKMPEEDLMRFVEGKMSEDEMQQFVMKATTGEGLDTEPAPVPEQTAPEPEKTSAAEVKEPAEIVKKAENNSEMIKRIISRVESFLTKMQTIPDVEAKIISWQKKGALTKTVPPLDWFVFQFDAEKFVQRLRTLVARDPIKKQFAYLKNLSTESPALEKLKGLARELETTERSIELPPFGIGKMSVKSKQALQKTVNNLVRIIKEDSIATALDEIIATYEPEAKKLRELLLALEQKAQEAAARTRRQTPSITAGTLPRDQYPTGDRYGTPPGSGGYTPPPARDQGVSSGGDKGRGEKKPKSDKKPDSSKGGGKGSASSKKEEKPLSKEQEKVVKDAEKLIKELDSKLNEAAQEIKKSTILQNPKQVLLDRSPLEESFYTAAPKIIKALGLRGGALDKLNTIELITKGLPDAERVKGKKLVKEVWRKYEGTLKTSLRAISDVQKTIRTFESKISPAKRYLYLGVDALGNSKTVPTKDLSVKEDEEEEIANKAAIAYYLKILGYLEDIIVDKEELADTIDIMKAMLVGQEYNAPESKLNILGEVSRDAIETLIHAIQEIKESGLETAQLLPTLASGPTTPFSATPGFGVFNVLNKEYPALTQLRQYHDLLVNQLLKQLNDILTSLQEIKPPALQKWEPFLTETIQKLNVRISQLDAAIKKAENVLAKNPAKAEVDQLIQQLGNDLKTDTTLLDETLVTAATLAQAPTGLQNENRQVQQAVFEKWLEALNKWATKINDKLVANAPEIATFMETAAKPVKAYSWLEQDKAYSTIFDKLDADDQNELRQRSQELHDALNVFLQAAQEDRDNIGTDAEPNLGTGTPLIAPKEPAPAPQPEAVAPGAPKTVPTPDQGKADQLEALRKKFPAPTTSIFEVASAQKDAIDALDKFTQLPKEEKEEVKSSKQDTDQKEKKSGKASETLSKPQQEKEAQKSL